MDILRPNSLLNRVLPHPIEKVHKAKADIFPLWVAESAEVLIANLGNTNLRLALIYPKRQLEFNQLAGLQRLIGAKLNVPTVLVADDINPKYRSLFVKNRIPYIYKDETIFAPELGVVLNSQRTAPLVFKNVNVNLTDSEIGPFELKLIAAYLTSLLHLENFNLQELSLRLKKT
ncbi:MAG: hypothetical protein IT289_12710, partial [Oligoflexia bacterium]|nr:hypothetical protein [Oligoflexia bacterium]